MTLLIGSSLSLSQALGQQVDPRRQKMINEATGFFNAYSALTTLNSNYAFYYVVESGRYFFWNKEKDKKLFHVEDVLDSLEAAHADTLVERLKERYLQTIRNSYDQYHLLIAQYQFAGKMQTVPWKSFPYVSLNDSIVSLQDCFWQRTSKGWRLENAIDTLKTYDPWRPQKPRDKGSIDRELQIAIYNYQDTDITPKYLDSLENDLIKQKFHIDPGIYGLVNSEYFRAKSAYDVKIPAVLQLWINETLSNLKSIIPDTWKPKVRNAFISYTPLVNETLWFRSDQDSIYISPFLVRAVYIKYLYGLFKNNTEGVKAIPFYIQSFQNTQARTFNDDSSLYNRIKKPFQDQFVFILLHEMSHIVFNLSTDLSTEELCDCNAAEVMLSKKVSFQLGIFMNILFQSIAEGNSNLWNITNQKAIKDRLIRITDKKGKLTDAACSGIFERAAFAR